MLTFCLRFLSLTPLPRRRSCAGLRLSKNLLPSLLSSVPLVPWGKRVQKYDLFSNWQALFSNIFHLFYILLTTREKKVHLLWVFPSFGSVFRGKNGSQGCFSRAFFGPTEVFLRQIWRKSGCDESGWEEDTLLYIIRSSYRSLAFPDSPRYCSFLLIGRNRRIKAASIGPPCLPLAVTADKIRSLLHYVLPFLLDKKGRKNQGRHHRSQHTKRALPRHVGRAHAPYPVSLWRSQSETVVGHFCLSTASEPKASSRRNIRDPLRYRGTPPLYGIAGLRPR